MMAAHVHQHAHTGLSSDPRAMRLVEFYELLTPQTLHTLSNVYSADAHFIDPFNDVHGHAAVLQVFVHMFATLDAPRFIVSTSVAEGDECFLLWDFTFRRQGHAQTMSVHGATHARFAPDGRVSYHRDYWDPARQIYEGLPILGSVLRWLRRRLSATVPKP